MWPRCPLPGNSPEPQHRAGSPTASSLPPVRTPPLPACSGSAACSQPAKHAPFLHRETALTRVSMREIANPVRDEDRQLKNELC